MMAARAVHRPLSRLIVPGASVVNHTVRFAIAAVLCAFAVWWYARRTTEAARDRAEPPGADAGSAAPAPSDVELVDAPAGPDAGPDAGH